MLGHSGLGHSYGLASPIGLGAIGGHGLALGAQPIVLGHGYAAAPALHGLGGLGKYLQLFHKTTLIKTQKLIQNILQEDTMD